jgi:hypothetical protein
VAQADGAAAAGDWLAAAEAAGADELVAADELAGAVLVGAAEDGWLEDVEEAQPAAAAHRSVAAAASLAVGGRTSSRPTAGRSG